ncbi:MAG: glycosyltransferase, partial [Chloroflexi bacterium]|nr:glycosyltransferase [Chloroflexota bacterium]
MQPALAGVNVAGYLRSRTGVGTVSRRYVRALRALGAPVALKDLSELNPVGVELSEARFDAEHPHPVNLICVNAVEHPAFAWYVGEPFLRDKYNIGVWFWELPAFPSEWCDRFVHYDELWAPTAFIANTLAPISPVPVVRIPVVLTPDTTQSPGARDRGRQRLGAKADEYVYLFVFDFMSYMERKNPIGLIDAFRAAFAPDVHARLVIKCVNGDFNPRGLALLRERASGYPIDVIDGYRPAQEMDDLVAACDAFVSLHRSEGLGLTMAEAMAAGKPVAATGWSGNTEFMNVANSFPIRYQLVELEQAIGPYQAGSVWAEPSVEHAAEML